MNQQPAAMKTCPVCGTPFVPKTNKITCGNKSCAVTWHKTNPGVCACGMMGVKFTPSGWVCQRCLDIEQMLIEEEEKAARRRRDQRSHNTRDELGWKRYIENEWLPEERRRERVLTLRQLLAATHGLTS